MKTTLSMRLALLTRSWARVEVVGPRTVRGDALTKRGIRHPLHILRCRLVDMGDRFLLVSTQHIAYRCIADPSSWLCPVCYAIHEDKYYADRTTHYPMTKSQLKLPCQCESCGEWVTPIDS